jgi:hypothetical protein
VVRAGRRIDLLLPSKEIPVDVIRDTTERSITLVTSIRGQGLSGDPVLSQAEQHGVNLGQNGNLHIHRHPITASSASAAVAFLRSFQTMRPLEILVQALP